MHKAEQLIAAANQVGDVSELRRQPLSLSRLYARIPDGEGDATRALCTSAIQNLSNLSRDLTEREDATKALAALRSRDTYRTYAKRCEAETGMPAPKAPNFRAR